MRMRTSSDESKYSIILIMSTVLEVREGWEMRLAALPHYSAVQRRREAKSYKDNC